MKAALFLFSLFASSHAMAQWAVYDEKVHEQLTYINKIEKLKDSDLTRLDQHYKSQLGEGGDKGADLTLGDGDSKTVLKGLDTKFDELSDLTDEDKKKYVGTLQDCGDDQVNPAHYQACVGLRNLRLQTLKQSQGMLKTLKFRREQIVKLVEESRKLGVNGNDPKAGQLQRYQFELQAQQALLQTDALQLQILMDGYKQREQTYAMQMNEARRSSDRGALDPKAGRPRNKAVPFVSPKIFN
ncbi:hypothetical protein [Hydrogenophaga electricum]|uniref:hypothetical protein n=1 Tax=Hydrogenophaga electricum TaxID=1230953 RepID=UPI0024E128C0|nr:hypothetical protein [Hydrogenophaga electricum]